MNPSKSSPQQNVLLLAPEIFAAEGGIARILQLYLRALSEIHGAAHVQLLALNDSPADVARGATAGVRGTGCGRSRMMFIRTALRLARTTDCIVCGHVAQLPVAWLARKANPRLRYFVVAHGIEVWRRFNAAERVALRGAERVICVSNYTRERLLQHIDLPRERTAILHNALDPRFEITPGRPLAECPPAILTVSRLRADERYKGIDTLISALPAIRASVPGAALKIIGRGDDLPRLRALAVNCGVADAVEFLGYVDDTRLQTELRSCRLFALPSTGEGFGLVFLEAMACGRPCLAVEHTAPAEIVTPETGVLARHGDSASIAEASLAALRGQWAEHAITDRAVQFSYEHFRRRVAGTIA